MLTKNIILNFDQTHRILLRADDFIYLLPHPALRDFISNYTITFPNRDIISENYTVIPHGSATLVFSCDRFGRYGRLFGPASKPCMVGECANQADMLLIIEFQPAGFHAFAGVDQKELSDRIFSMEMLNPMLNRAILEMLDSTENLKDLLTCLDRIFLTNLNRAYPGEFLCAAKLIVENCGNISNKELTESICYSSRHLNRIFDQYLGMNAKTFSRMVRINKAIRLLQNPKYSISIVSDLTGFYDVSHFIHDFKSLSGIMPVEYRNKMSDFYSEIAKF